MKRARLVDFVESMPAEFDYRSTTSLQNVVTNAYEERVEPTAAVEHGKPITFVLPCDNHYTQLNGTRVDILCKVTRTGGVACTHGAAPADDRNYYQDKVCVSNNVLHTMFESIKLTVNNDEVECVRDYPYVSFIDDFTTRHHQHRDRHGAMVGWERDTAGKLAVAEYNGENVGMNNRSHAFANSAEVRLTGKLHSALMEQGLCIMPKTDIRLTLQPATDAFVLIAKEHTYELRIVSAHLWVQRKVVKEALNLAHITLMSGRLMNNELPIPVLSKGVKALTIASGHRESTLTVFDNELLPDRVLVGFVSNASKVANLNANPFDFKHYGVSYLQMHVNGNETPKVPYEPSWTTPGGYLREYRALLEAYDATADDTLRINLEEYARGYSLFPFQIAQRVGNLLAPQGSGKLTLRVKFAAALTEVVNVLVFYDRRDTITIPSALRQTP